MINTNPTPDEFMGAAIKIAEETDTDIILYNGPLMRHTCTAFNDACIDRTNQGKTRKNVTLMIVTTGGDPDVAYRIARCLQGRYEKVSIFVSGYCKSAGTLVALGGHELIVSDHGELGPLDVQMRKHNSLFESQSGLTVNASLAAIQDRAMQAFREQFLFIEHGTGGAVSVESAGKMATELAASLYGGLISQLDPLHVGEAKRAMTIALQYGRRLIAVGQNATDDGLARLIGEYPNHSFVIDRAEAREIFSNVRGPTIDEAVLAYGFQPLSRIARNEDESEGNVFTFINDAADAYFNAKEDDDKRDQDDESQDGKIQSVPMLDGGSDSEDTAKAGGDVPTDRPDGEDGEGTQLQSA